MTDFRLPVETHIGYAHLYTADLARSLNFYGEQVGFKQLGTDGNTVTLSADGTTPHLLLTEHTDWMPKPARSTGLYHVAIRLPSRAALSRLFARLVQARYPFGGFSDHAVSEALYLNDPDGNGLELYRDRPRDQWRYDGKQVQMTTVALDVEKLLREADDAPWTGIDPATDIGHVHFHVANLKQAEAFYVDVLGMDVASDWSGHGAIFVSAGGYHHHIGLNVWAGSARQPARTLGLRTFSLVVPTADSLAELRERFYTAAVTVEDEVTGGFTVRDPVGNAITLVSSN